MKKPERLLKSLQDGCIRETETGYLLA